ncbi:MAG: SAM-dependent DNA methyltransferase, partial [Acidobacteria bacterium]|nr:SAM-dependent DNA methyltransferase [Acidobacteriota bacterium]
DKAWRREAEKARMTLPAEPGSGYQDVAGFCRSATTEDIATHGCVLTPGRYVGAEEVEDDGEPFEEKMRRLVRELEGQFEESARLEKAIRQSVGRLTLGR